MLQVTAYSVALLSTVHRVVQLHVQEHPRCCPFVLQFAPSHLETRLTSFEIAAHALPLVYFFVSSSLAQWHSIHDEPPWCWNEVCFFSSLEVLRGPEMNFDEVTYSLDQRPDRPRSGAPIRV